MPKTVSTSEVSDGLGPLVNWVLNNQDEVIVESGDGPAVVIMPYAEYEKVRTLREQERAALERVRRLRAVTLERNHDLAPEQGDELAARFAREFVEDMVREGRIEFVAGGISRATYEAL